MQQSESVAILIQALLKAQSEFTVVPKNKKGQEGNRTFKYADLADVMNMALPKLNKHGIFLSQPLVLDKDGEHLRQTTKLQLDDEFIQSDGIRLKSSAGADKQLGIEVTYARRIDLNGTLGISPDEDMDAPDLKPTLTGTQTATTVVRSTPQQIDKAFKPNAPESGPKTGEGTPYGVIDEDITNVDPSYKRPLTKERNDQIQNRLKELASTKVLDRRKLQLFLDAEHGGKRAFDVDADTWENTISKIELAVQGGEAAIKVLLKPVAKE